MTETCVPVSHDGVTSQTECKIMALTFTIIIPNYSNTTYNTMAGSVALLATGALASIPSHSAVTKGMCQIKILPSSHTASMVPGPLSKPDLREKLHQ